MDQRDKHCRKSWRLIGLGKFIEAEER